MSRFFIKHSKNPKEVTQSNDVTDPTDFLQTSLPQLSDLDTLLRCHVCKDFLKTPVLTPCGHTFCSLCIREYLNRELKCPLCLVELRESMLRSEFLVNEIIGSYLDIRSRLMKCLEPVKNLETKENESSVSTMIEIPSDDGNATDGDDDIEITGVNNSRPAKRGLESLIQGGKKPRRETKESNASLDKYSKLKTEHLGQCPICQKSYPLEYLQRTHLDECLTLGTLDTIKTEKTLNGDSEANHTRQNGPTSTLLKKKSTSPALSEVITHSKKYMDSAPTQNYQRLPKLNFSSMSIAQLKQKLSSLNLSTAGHRQQMITRYNHYEMLWNSNFLDSIEPMSEKEIRRKLASWETAHNVDNSSNSISNMLRGNAGGVHLNRMKDFKNDRFDRKGWIKEHRNEFKELLKEARNSLENGTKRPEREPKTKEKEHVVKVGPQVPVLANSATNNSVDIEKTNIGVDLSSDADLEEL